MKKFLNLLLVPCLLAFVALASGCAFRADASPVGLETPDFASLNFQSGLIERVYNVNNFDEFFAIYFEYAWENGCQCVTGEEREAMREEVEAFQRFILLQEHAPRQAYLDDFDVLIQILDEKFNLTSFMSEEIAATRWLIENFFHMNDLVFNTFLATGVFRTAESLEGICVIGVMPKNMINWDFGEFHEARDEFAFAMQHNPFPYDFMLPNTNTAVILWTCECYDDENLNTFYL